MQENYERLKLMDWIAIEAKLTKVFKADLPNDWTGISWHGNGKQVPRDSIECGWEGEFCVEEGGKNIILVIALSVVGVLAIIISVIVASILTRRYMYEQSLKGIGEITVKWDDIIKDKGLMSKSTVSLGGQLSSDVQLKYHSIEQGMINNRHVIIQRFKGDGSVDLQDRQILIDLKEMRDLHHD